MIFSTLTWYKELRAQPVKKTLSMDDFKDGTFRITEPGRYQLTEDIVFAPNAHLTDSTARFWQVHLDLSLASASCVLHGLNI